MDIKNLYNYITQGKSKAMCNIAKNHNLFLLKFDRKECEQMDGRF